MTKKDAKGVIRLHQNEKTPRRLPSITMDDGKTYFIDERLRELRNIASPHDFIRFSSELEMQCYLGEHETTETEITVLCPQCSKVLFKGSKEDTKRLIVYCVDCVCG